MGRHQFGGHQNFKVVANEGQRRTYLQHDDRETGSHRRGGSRNLVWRKDDQYQKRVSFHSDRRGGGIQKRGVRGRLGGVGSQALNVIIEEDDSRGERSHQSGRARPVPGSMGGKYSRGGRGGRGSSRGGRGAYIVPSNLIMRRATSSSGIIYNWSKVTVVNAAKFSKEDVCNAIMEAYQTTNSNLKFAPIAFAKHGMDYNFFVEFERVATELEKLSRNIYLYGDPNNALSLRVDRAAPPRLTISDEAMEHVKIAMSNRYTPATKALDLKSFHTDPVFLREALFVPLSRGIVFKKIIQIIEENVPEVEAIDISENRLNTIDQLAAMLNKTRNIKILYLSNNRIDDISEMNSLKGLPIIDLKLEGNPLLTKLGEGYIRVVRKLFPSLQKLDGNDLPKLITFEDDGPDSQSQRPDGLPRSQQKVVCNEEAGKVVLQFLEEYFKVYDSDNRQALIDAYHENAVMSLAASYPSQSSTAAGMKEYIVQSRNLCRVADPTRRQKLLHQGRLSIFAFLKDLPKTEHDPTSFTLDLPFATERLMTFSVMGVFRERDQGQNSMRHFYRTFVVVPQGSGFCIVNETLYITTATAGQLRTYFKTPVASVQTPDPQTAQGLVTSLSQKTGMNAIWSKKCLEEIGWDLVKAEVAFRNANQEGKIPIEAFEQ